MNNLIELVQNKSNDETDDFVFDPIPREKFNVELLIGFASLGTIAVITGTWFFAMFF